MMDNKYTTYTNPLTDRYCSKDMSYIFSPQFKFSTWRKLWVALAEGEKELGINITEEQLDELRNNIDNINFDEARKIEKEVYNTEEFNHSWLTDEVSDLYSEDRETAHIYSVFALIAIAISCLGLFGLSLFDIRQRLHHAIDFAQFDTLPANF